MELLAQLPLVREGGVVMLLLYAVSVVGLAVVLERLVALRRAVVLPRTWAAEVRAVVGAQGLAALGEGTGWPRAVAPRALRRLLEVPPINPIELQERVQWILDREAQPLFRGLALLGLTAAIAPLLGLLGTVLGMIVTFRAIAAGGVGDPKVLADGIYQALYTTAVGLSLAIPFTVAHRLLGTRARRLTGRVADFLEELWWLERGRRERPDA